MTQPAPWLFCGGLGRGDLRALQEARAEHVLLRAVLVAADQRQRRVVVAAQRVRRRAVEHLQGRGLHLCVRALARQAGLVDRRGEGGVRRVRRGAGAGSRRRGGRGRRGRRLRGRRRPAGGCRGCASATGTTSWVTTVGAGGALRGQRGVGRCVRIGRPRCRGVPGVRPWPGLPWPGRRGRPDGRAPRPRVRRRPRGTAAAPSAPATGPGRPPRPAP